MVIVQRWISNDICQVLCCLTQFYSHRAHTDDVTAIVCILRSDGPAMSYFRRMMFLFLRLFVWFVVYLLFISLILRCDCQVVNKKTLVQLKNVVSSSAHWSHQGRVLVSWVSVLPISRPRSHGTGRVKSYQYRSLTPQDRNGLQSGYIIHLDVDFDVIGFLIHRVITDIVWWAL